MAAALSSSTRTSTNAEARAFYGAIGYLELENVSPAAIRGVIGQVRTRLVERTSEIISEVGPASDPLTVTTRRVAVAIPQGRMAAVRLPPNGTGGASFPPPVRR